MESRPRLVKSIQWLRGIAALAVVELHASGVLGKYGVLVHEDPATLGRAGVDVFFVISGFIMYFITQSHSGIWSDTLTFWRQRAVRVVPLYWLTTSLVVIAAILAPGITEYRISLDHVVASFLFVPWTDLRGITAPPLRVGWSLNFEAYFYLVFGLMALFPRRVVPLAAAAWAVTSVLAGLSLVPNGPVGQALSSPLLLEFASGIVISAAWVRGAVLPRPAAWLALILGIVALAAAGATAPDLNEAIKFGIPGAAIVAGVVALEARGALTFEFAPMLWLGEWSYAIYLTHVFGVALFGRIIRKLPVLLQLPPGCNVALGVALAACLGALTNKLVERPAHRLLSGARR